MLPMPPDAHVPARCPIHDEPMHEGWMGRPECATCDDEQTLAEDIRRARECRCNNCGDCSDRKRGLL